MSSRVFISFSSKDQEVSEKICDALESRGQRCWISTRSIRPGENFQESIVAAIRAARVMVLVFTRHANESNEMKKELALASQGGLAVIPVRVEDVLPTDAFAYEFATRQWLDLSSNWDRQIEALAAEIERQVPPALAEPQSPPQSASSGELAAPVTVVNNLPALATSFIGRQAELQELMGLIASHRIVTLLGSGGLGKTRLSLEAAWRLKDTYPDGVWLLELAPITDPRLVAESLANLLGLTVPEGRTATDVASGYLRQKTVLVILDNCEHLIAAAAALAEGLTRASPGCSVVASSREPLGVPGEMVFRMPLLGVPPADATLDATSALTYPAVRLFVDRAASALGRYELGDADAPVVAAICRQLDGIALAIELAAPRLKMLKPAQLLEKLADRFKILTGGSRTALPRQQTLRALIDWSFNLLSPVEQVLMRRLAIFASGWTLDGATAVVVGEGIEDWEIFDGIASLVDKSLVMVDQSGVETRYRFLETTRQYADEKLGEAGEAGLFRRLAEYLVDLLAAADEAFETESTRDWLARYEPELGNLRAAIDWAAGPDGERSLCVALTAYGERLWNSCRLMDERRRWFERADAWVDATTPVPVAARMLLGRASRQIVLGLGAGRSDGERAIELARSSGEPFLLARALGSMVAVLLNPDTLDESQRLLDEALNIIGSHGKTKMFGKLLRLNGIAAAARGDVEAACRAYEDSLAILREVDVDLTQEPLASMAEALFNAGEIDRAIATAREALALARNHSDPWWECLGTANLAAYLLIRGETSDGAALARGALGQAIRLEDRFLAALAIQHVSLARALAGELEVAARLLGFVDHVYRAEGAVREATELRTYERLISLLRAGIPESDLPRLLEDGAAKSLDRAGALALHF